MAGEAVKKLVSAERDAALGIEEAKTAAKKLLADASEKGAALLLEEEENAVKRAGALMAKAEQAAHAEKANIIAEAESEREKLVALAAGKMSAAVALITERVVKG